MTSSEAKAPAGAEEHRALQVVGFVIGEEEYAIDVLDVVGVERVGKVLRLPRMPKFIVGVVSIREEVVPLVALRRRFELDDREEDEQTRLLVIELGDVTVGLVVDAVTSVYRLTAAAAQAAPPMAVTVDSRFVKGVLRAGEKMLIFLDPYQIIRSDELEELARTAVLARHYVGAAEGH
jgi:purine-binding chemotaxis protein CheW